MALFHNGAKVTPPSLPAAVIRSAYHSDAAAKLPKLQRIAAGVACNTSAVGSLTFAADAAVS